MSCKSSTSSSRQGKPVARHQDSSRHRVVDIVCIWGIIVVKERSLAIVSLNQIAKHGRKIRRGKTSKRSVSDGSGMIHGDNAKDSPKGPSPSRALFARLTDRSHDPKRLASKLSAASALAACRLHLLARFGRQRCGWQVLFSVCFGRELRVAIPRCHIVVGYPDIIPQWE